jgi:hypothetical protein
MEEEEEEYWMVVSAIFEGREASGLPSESSYTDRSSDSSNSTPFSDPINNKVSIHTFIAFCWLFALKETPFSACTLFSVPLIFLINFLVFQSKGTM